MEGHRDVVSLLLEKGANIENINSEGRTPLMESLDFGHGSLAELLVQRGASTFAKNTEGASVLEIAKQRLEEIEEYEWMLSRMENETHARHLQRKENRACYTRIMDLCLARIKSRRKMRGGRLRHQDQHQGVTLTKMAAGLNSEITVMLTKFTAPMANTCKTFGFLDRGSPYDEVFAVSGYSRGKFGGIDGCLDREVWIGKVFGFCASVGHALACNADKDGDRPGNYHACHAEKQLMAYFLWKRTTLQEEPNQHQVDEDEDEEAGSNDENMWINYECIKESSYSSPEQLNAQPTIYIRNDQNKVCSDCRRFQELVHIKTGVHFEIKAC